MVTQRLRDPIHDLIVFDEKDDDDMLAWELIKTREFQRLRRVRQLGLSEYVFPGATHTRFAHSIGVFNNARRLLRVLSREGKAPDKHQRRVVLVSALLHDLGHGPFSHAFEVAREAVARSRGEEAVQKHEKWSAKLIQAQDGEVLKLVGPEIAARVGALIEAEEPKDVFHAVVSSSFDADRLDYVMRDRYMTGAGAGAIDQEWLIDNLVTYEIGVPQDDDMPRRVPTFVFKSKGRQAAEDFLLARYRLYSQIYLHKTTRGFEQLISALFRHVGSNETDVERLGLTALHPLVVFLRSPEQDENQDTNTKKLRAFRTLDDTAVWACLSLLAECADDYARVLANRLLWRRPLRVIDVTARFIQNENDDAQVNAEKRIEDRLGSKFDRTVFRDSAPLNLYSRIGGESAKEHKKVRVLDGGGNAREIPDFPDTIIDKRLMKKQTLLRYYFLYEDDKEIAEKAIEGR